MAREFDLLEPISHKALRRTEPVDPSVDTFVDRFRPFGNRIQDYFNEQQQQNDLYYRREKRNPLNPSRDPYRVITEGEQPLERLPPAIGAPMASSGAPPPMSRPPLAGLPPPGPTGPGGVPLGAPPEAPSPEMMAQARAAQPPTGLPPSVTAVPPGVPGPGGAPSGQQPSPMVPTAGPLMVGPNGELPSGFRYVKDIPGGLAGVTSEQITDKLGGLGRTALDLGRTTLDYIGGRGGGQDVTEPAPVDTGRPPGIDISRAPKTDSLRPFIEDMRAVSERLGRPVLDALPPEAVSKALDSPGNAASAARWARAYEAAVTGRSMISLGALSAATGNLNRNLGTDINPKDLIARIRSERAPTPAVPVPEDAAASGGSEAAAAREVASARLAQGARGTARAQAPGSDRPGKTRELAQAVLDMIEGPMRAVLSSPYTAGMTPADYTDIPGADYPQQQMTNMAASSAVMRLGAGARTFPRGAPTSASQGPQLALPPQPRLALPAPETRLPPGFMDQLRQSLESRQPMSLGELPPAAPTGRRAAGQYIRRMEEMPPKTIEELAAGIEDSRFLPTAPPSGRRSGGHMRRRMQETGLSGDMLRDMIDRGWTLSNDGRWVPPGPVGGQ